MLLTFGHGTASAEQMTELLRGAGVSALVDVRTAPGSRRHPHVARAELERWLPEAGISYRWDKRLGGFRRPGPDSPDVAWREDMFRGYAEHMRTAGFSAAVDEVLAGARTETTAVMCAESLWWRCHRRLLADYVCAVRGVAVRHLLHDGRLEDHRLSPGLRLRDDGLLVYDAGQSPLLLEVRPTASGEVCAEAGGLPGGAVGGDRERLVAVQVLDPVAGSRAHSEGRGGIGVGDSQSGTDDGDTGQAGGGPASVRIDDMRAALGDA
jgi:Protein of unknown function, DUF488